MRLLGFELRRVKAARSEADRGWLPLSGPSSWYRPPTHDLTMGEMTAHSAVFASVGLLAGDVSKLRIKVMARQSNNIWTDVRDHYSELLARPNHYQTRAQFIESWMYSRLLYGNTYVLKKRDTRGRVVAMYVLDPCRVTPLVADSGAVFYRLSGDKLNKVREELSEQDLTIPASEVIHDRSHTFHHPLIGVSPICAAAYATKVGVKIQSNAADFFGNKAQPGGILTAPAGMSSEDAASIKNYWNENSASGNVTVIGADLKYTSFAMSGADAQLIEQLRFSAEDVARAFRIPPHMIGAAPPPAYANVEALTAAYYSQTLQTILEHIEGVLDAGLGFTLDTRCEFDIAALMRMDTATRYKANSDAVSGGWMSPNEARARENLPPVAGGESPYLQQQNWSLEQLSRRSAPTDAPVATTRSAGHRGRSQIIRDMLDAGYSDEQAARQAGLPTGWTAKSYLDSVGVQ